MSAIRPANEDDFPAILDLNAESVHFLSPLTLERLTLLSRSAAYHRVVDANGVVAAFLLAFRESAPYDSPNYKWFEDRYTSFFYIDRVVVRASEQGRGLGPLLYDDVFACARAAGVVRVVCEYDIEPPNEVSRRFHERRGFREVGRQTAANGTKIVSLQEVTLGPAL